VLLLLLFRLLQHPGRSSRIDICVPSFLYFVALRVWRYHFNLKCALLDVLAIAFLNLFGYISDTWPWSMKCQFLNYVPSVFENISLTQVTTYYCHHLNVWDYLPGIWACLGAVSHSTAYPHMYKGRDNTVSPQKKFMYKLEFGVPSQSSTNWYNTFSWKWAWIFSMLYMMAK
jgi:hypothetical protein